MGLGDFLKQLFGSSVKSALGGMVENAESFADSAIDKAKDAAAPLIDKVKDFVESAKEKFSESFRSQ